MSWWDEAPVGSFGNRVLFPAGRHSQVVSYSHHVDYWEDGAVGKSDPARGATFFILFRFQAES